MCSVLTPIFSTFVVNPFPAARLINDFFQVYYNETWLYVYLEEGTGWGLAEATVYCRSLGYMIVTESTQSSLKAWYFGTHVTMSCTGEEENALNCHIRSHNPLNSKEPTTVYYPKVKCTSGK